MQFSFDVTYDASLEEVHAMLADPAFRERVCERAHAVEHEVEVTPAGEGMTVRVDQTLPAGDMPSFAQKVIGDRIRIVQEERWPDRSGADLAVTIPGKPGTVSGRITLEQAGSGTRETVYGDVKVSVPLVGGKLERLVADMLGAALRNEHRVGRTWLTGER